MSKINFLKPDKDNLTIFLYMGLFLFNLSKNMYPLCSILIKYKPTKPIIIGTKKLKMVGRKPVKFT